MFLRTGARRSELKRRDWNSAVGRKIYRAVPNPYYWYKAMLGMLHSYDIYGAAMPTRHEPPPCISEGVSSWVHSLYRDYDSLSTEFSVSQLVVAGGRFQLGHFGKFTAADFQRAEEEDAM